MDNKQALQEELINLGFEEKYIKQCLDSCDNIEQAINLILALQEGENKPVQLEQPMNNTKNVGLFTNIDDIPFDIDFSNIRAPMDINVGKRHKMVCVVRMDLKMGIGKIAAQTGHAVLGAYQRILEHPQGRSMLDQWEDSGQAKVVVKCDSLPEMQELREKSEQIGLNTYTVQDAGRTQVEPGSLTVMAIGPGDSDTIDQVTRHLKLL